MDELEPVRRAGELEQEAHDTAVNAWLNLTYDQQRKHNAEAWILGFEAGWLDAKRAEW